MALTLYGGSMVMPYMLAMALAMAVRILLTGALHEDGLADFFDGFGAGGHDRERILAIMKDSQIGTYGVLGLIVYALLLYLALLSFPPKVAAMAVFAGDAYSKMLSAQIIQMMPYARTEQDSKAHNVYRKMNVKAGLLLFVQGMLPMGLLFWTFGWQLRWDMLIFVPGITMYFIYLLIWKRLRGYTGDCCGALCLLVELSFYLTLSAMLFEQNYQLNF